MNKSVLISFEATDSTYSELGDNFRWITYREYEGEKEVGFACLMPNGDINDGTQEGTLEGEYSVNLAPSCEVTYHNNEDGQCYTQDEFIAEFTGTDRWQLMNEYGMLEDV